MREGKQFVCECDRDGRRSRQHFGDDSEGEERRPDHFAEAPQLRVCHFVQHGSHEIKVGTSHLQRKYESDCHPIRVFILDRAELLSPIDPLNVSTDDATAPTCVEAEQTFHPPLPSLAIDSEIYVHRCRGDFVQTSPIGVRSRKARSHNDTPLLHHSPGRK